MSYFVHRDRVFMVREKVELGLGKNGMEKQ